MALNKITTLLDQHVSGFNPSAGSASGSNTYLVAPFRGQLMDAGFSPQTSVTSNMTLAIAIVKAISSTASLVSEVVTSTLGSFNSVALNVGQVASAAPPSPAYVEAGDLIRLTTSGGNGVTIGATMFANFRRG